jgi:hypothetical protein
MHHSSIAARSNRLGKGAAPAVYEWPTIRPGPSVNTTPLIVTVATPNGQESPPSVALDYWRRLRRRSHSPRAERITVKPPSSAW